MWQQTQRTKLHILILTLILGVAAALRIYDLSANCLWMDEYFSLECSSGWGRTDMHLNGSQTVPDLVSLRNARPIGSIWGSIARDENHPPLYFILLRIWREMFGDSIAALRSLSVIASLGGIVLLYFVGETAFGPVVALWACALMAVSWPQIQQAQQARAYALVTTVALGCLLALVRIQRYGVTWPRLAALFLTALILPLLHYLAATTLLAMVLYAAIGLRGNMRASVLGCFACVVMAYGILWGPELLGQHKLILAGTSWMVGYGEHTISDTMQELAGICVRFLVEPRGRELALAMGGLAVFIVPPMMFRRMPQLLLWWLWLVVPIGGALVLDLCFQRRSLAIVKYTLVAAPALYLLIGLLARGSEGFSIPVRRAASAIPVLIILGCLMCVPNAYSTDLPDWREFARFVRGNNNSEMEPVVVVGADLQTDGYRALGLTYNLAGTNSPIFLLKDVPTPKFFASLHGAHEVCVIGESDLSSIALPAGSKFEGASIFPQLAIAEKFKLGANVATAN
jgi:hypothetical protein